MELAFEESRETGQALTEYILLLAFVVAMFLIVSKWVTKSGLANQLTQSLSGPFVAAYRYGHTQGKGLDDGGPKNHPRFSGRENNFRIFFNPDAK